MEEKWKDIEGYEGLYQVSNLGNVRSLYFKNNICNIKKIKNKKITKDKKGYCRVRLTKNKKFKSFLVHRLVAQAFIPNPNNYPIVNHKDENPTNNCIDNLEWCTNQYNLKYSNVWERVAKIRGKKIIQYDLNGRIVKIWENSQKIENELNIHKQSILYACKNKTKNTKGYIWRYVNE